ncbi:tyrosine-type recombinase/integrase [Streptomyces sp. NPDC051561]|uniref:tyrosine-type recombinase/integrase n=1 Tax=Streptomyces sp. NPDC051561 TaxID=3365658 RepID=UPI0037906038
MARRATNNPRQLRSKTCGCQACTEHYPPAEHGERKRRRDCLGSWQARYRDPAGKQCAKNFAKKKEAEAFLDRTRDRVRSRTYQDPKRGEIALEEWWDLWWPGQPKGRPTTVNRKLSSWNAHILPKWGKWRLCDLEYQELQTWITTEIKGYHARRKTLELLRGMLRGAVRDGKRIPYNPAADIELPVPPKKHADELRPPTREQCALIREHAAMYYGPLLVFLEETGLRWGEATGMRWGNVDLDAQHVKVKEVLIDDRGTLFRQPAPKTVAGFRTVPLTPDAVAAARVMVDRWRPKRSVSPIGDGKDLHPDELLFRGPQGGVLTRHNFRRTWIPAIQAAGLAREVKNPETGRMEYWPRVHDLRHVFATRLKDLGVKEKEVQAVMGHDRGSKVTWLYQHAPEEVAAHVLAAMVPSGAPDAPVRTLRAVESA